MEKFKIKLPFMKNSRAAKASAAAHHTRLGKDPYFDWTVILALCIAVAVLGVSFSFALWHEVSSGVSNSDVSASASSPVPSPTLNTAALQKIIAAESAKSATISQYSKGYPDPADPSI